MRLLVTADLHYNHPRSTALANEVIDQMNRAGGDAVLLVGDTATPDGDHIERCLSRFTFNGPRLFVAGNHELWTHGQDSYCLFTEELPRRIRELGWQWLEADPFISDDVAIVGTVGWYDYSFAPAEQNIPRRFYEHKISPGAAARLPEFAHLFTRTDDIPPQSMETVARWNDGRFVKLGRGDERFLNELLTELRSRLNRLTAPHPSPLSPDPFIVVASHHLPFPELLPPSRSAIWDFARAYLGSPAIGNLLHEFPQVRLVLCGHSHLPLEAQVDHIHVVNIGCGYRWKTYRTFDLP